VVVTLFTERALSREEIKRAIRDYVVKEFLPGEDPASLTSDTKLFSDGILDSLASLKLVSYLEEQFGVTIEAHEVDVDHLDTLDTIADMVIGKTR
jgi:acyl carrier protein